MEAKNGNNENRANGSIVLNLVQKHGTNAHRFGFWLQKSSHCNDSMAAEVGRRRPPANKSNRGNYGEEFSSLRGLPEVCWAWPEPTAGVPLYRVGESRLGVARRESETVCRCRHGHARLRRSGLNVRLFLIGFHVHCLSVIERWKEPQV